MINRKYIGFVISKPFLCAVFFILFLADIKAQNPKPFTIPVMQYWEGGQGSFELINRSPLILSAKSPKSFIRYLQTFASDLTKFDPKRQPLIKIGKPVKGCIYFNIDSSDTSFQEESYTLNIAGFISVNAADEQGAFWATRTILQLLEQSATGREIPRGFSYDYPEYPVRGFVLDAGRKFFSLSFLENYVKLLAYYKMNDFHIHLNDNGFKKFFKDKWEDTYSAFRLENSTYPQLTAKDGSYTKKEFVALQQLAQSYGVRIIPEIDVPAHSLAFVKAIPEIGSKSYGDDHLDIHNPLTYQVIDNVFKEYLNGPDPVFTGDEIHIGTDEYAKADAEAFRAFTNHYIRLVKGFGKKVRLWGALTHAAGQTPVDVDSVTMNVWYNGYADPKAMMALGYEVISTPDSWLYIVPAAGYYYDYLNDQKIFMEWTPHRIGNQVFPKDNKQVKGGAFAVWNDHPGNGITEKDVHDRVFKSLQVLSQKMWSPEQANMRFETFSNDAGRISEGPGLNIAGKVAGKTSLVLAYGLKRTKIKDHSGQLRHALRQSHVHGVKIMNKRAILFNGNSSIQTPLEHIGYNYTVSFYVYPDKTNPDNAILFSSADACVKLKQGTSGKLGFSRENYDYSFDFEVPENTWTKITITGDHTGTTLFVNGELKQELKGQFQSFGNTKDKIAKVQTLFFPLKNIGDLENGFKGCLSDLKVFNRILSAEEIKTL